MASSLRKRVRERAGNCCEYCQISQDDVSHFPFHVEHIVARKHFGENRLSNLCFSCQWEVSEPGPMRLHMADILLYRARLFRDKGALAEARKLIEQCGYWRRKEELEDAEAALA